MTCLGWAIRGLLVRDFDRFDLSGGDVPSQRPFARRRRRPIRRWIAVAVAVAAIAVGATQLFLGPNVGVADNGDGWRVMCQSGLRPYPHRVLITGVVFSYVEQPAADTARCRPSAHNPYSYRSSQTVLVRLAKIIDGSGPAFDLRVLGWVSLALVGIAFFVATISSAGSRWPLLLSLGVTGVLAMDIGWLTYFHSPLSEPAEILGSVLVLAALPAWLRGGQRAVLRIGLLAFLAGGSALLVLAKSQTVALAPIIAGLLLLGRLDLGSFRGRVGARVPPALVGLLLILLAAGYQGGQGKDFDRINRHDAFFYGVLVASRNPAQTLADLKLPPALIRYVGHGWYPYDRHRLADPAYQQFQSRLHRTDVLRYLLRHPRLTERLYTRAATGAAQTRMDALGNYPVGTPQARRARLTHRFSPATTLLRWLRPVSSWLFPLSWLAAVLAGMLLLRPRGSPSWRATGGLLLFLGAGAAASNAAVVLGEGFFTLRKHQTLTAFYTAPLILLLPALAIGCCTWQASRWFEVRGRGGQSTR